MVIYNYPSVIESLPKGTVLDILRDNVFIASEDFEFEGLPVLKGSLVDRSGSIVYVNVVRENLLKKHLKEADKRDIVPVDGGDIFRPIGVRIYVNDGSEGTFVQLEGKERINDIPAKLDYTPQKVVFQGIEFSSVAYGFDMSNKGLFGLQ